MAVMVRDMLKQMGKTDKNVQMQIHPPKGPQKRIKKEGWKVLRLPLSFTYHLPIIYLSIRLFFSGRLSDTEQSGALAASSSCRLASSLAACCSRSAWEIAERSKAPSQQPRIKEPQEDDFRI